MSAHFNEGYLRANRERITELENKMGRTAKEIVKAKKVSKWDRHESLDRAHVVNEMFDFYVRESKFVQSDPKLREKAEKLGGDLYDFYNAIGLRIENIEHPPKKKKAKK